MDAIWFARPACLLALLPLALCWSWIAFRSRKCEAPWHRIVDSHLLAHVLVDKSRPGRRLIWLTLLAVAWLLAVASLAGPMFGKPAEKADTVARAQVLLIEIPEQKDATKDLQRNFETAIEALRQQAKRLPNHETAVLLYSRNPFLLIPPTTDRESIDRLLQDLAPGLLPEYGARPELALGMAEEMLKRNRFGEADVFWITAGKIAEGNGGTPEFPRRVSILFYGDDEYLAPQLAAHAGTTGAGFSRTLGNEIEPIHEARQFAPHGKNNAVKSGDMSPRELAPALIMLIVPLAIFASQSGALLGLLAFVLSVGLAFPQDAIADNASDWITDIQAWREWQYGDQALGAAQFVDPCWRATASYRLGRYQEAAAIWVDCPGADAAFNRGNALARSGRLDEAVAAYDQALQLRSTDADFKFNRNVVQGLIKPPPPPSPPKPDIAPASSIAPDFSETSNPPPTAAPSFNASRLSERTGSASPDKNQRFLRQIILIQDQRRNARKNIGSAKDPK